MRALLWLLSVLLLSVGCTLWSEKTEPPEEKRVEVDFEEETDVFSKIPLPPHREPDLTDPNSDVDCDGIPDWLEVAKTYANEKTTDPKNRDSDGDGIWDGVELGRTFSPDPACAEYFPAHALSPTGRTLTDPTRADSDCDGISDGDEDKNKNGRVDPGETDPTKVDSDDDGLWDGVELGITQGLLLKGVVQPEHPDELCEDTTKYAALCEGGSRRITNPAKSDTDGDTIPDGAEDGNKNGCFEPELGETDPLDAHSPNNAQEPEVRHACGAENLAPIDIRRNFAAQIALGLPIGFANNYVDIQGPNTPGLMGFEAKSNVAFVAWRHAARLDSLAQLTALMERHTTVTPTFSGLLARNRTETAFSSWELLSAQANALSVTFALEGNMSPAERVNSIAATLLGSGTDRLPETGASGDTQYVRAQYVLRDNGDVIVVMAVALDNNSSPSARNDGYFGLMDVAGGAALARHFDRTVVQCERSVATRGLVDFVFVVDDSGSMASAQASLANAGAAMAEALENSSLDWRVALVTSSYHTQVPPPLDRPHYYKNQGIIRGFTSDSQEFQSWLRRDSNCNSGRCSPGCITEPDGACSSTNHPAWAPPAPTCGGNILVDGNNGGCWISIVGNGAEGLLGAARYAVDNMAGTDIPPGQQFRQNAEVVLILMGDVDDQTTGYRRTAGGAAGEGAENINTFTGFFAGANPLGTLIPVHAIRCDRKNENGIAIACEQEQLVGSPRLEAVAGATNGILGVINEPDGIAATIEEIVGRTIGGHGVRTQKPLIGASLRVAIRNPMNASCNGANVPRSRQHGFDYNGIEQTVSFFGNCRPETQSHVAISYRAWEAMDESRMPCESDINFHPKEDDFCKERFTCDVDTDTCICPEDCGGCPQETPVCSRTATTCACTPPLT